MDKVSEFFIMIMHEHDLPTASSAQFSHTFPCCFCIEGLTSGFQGGIEQTVSSPFLSFKSVQAVDDCYLSRLWERSAPSILLLIASSQAATT